MNAGEQTIDWLYREQLQVDENWSVRTDTGFTWWADQNVQTIEILGEEAGPDGETAYLIGVRTDMLTDLDLTPENLAELNGGPMRFAAMSGPVYDADTRTLSLCSLGRVYGEIADWMGVVLGSAAVTQLAEARMLGTPLSEATGAKPALSGPPHKGLRTEPDEMLYAAQVFIEEGQSPCQWPEAAFTETVNGLMMQPPSLGASSGGQGFTVEFPYGAHSSLCQVFGTQPHPFYGNGLLVLQRFPFRVDSEAAGTEVALTLNATELTKPVTGYGFGSYSYDEGMICFSNFVPNALHRQVVLPNLYFSCAARARAMSLWLLDEDWGPDSFSPEHSAMGRKLKSDNKHDADDKIG